MTSDTLPTQQLYREHVLDHYRHPRNVGRLPAANAQASGYNPLCGDVVHVQLQITDGTVAAMTFTGQGCAISVATASLLSDHVAGQAVTAVQHQSLRDIEALLGVKLPPARIKCGLLALETIQQAIMNYGAA